MKFGSCESDVRVHEPNLEDGVHGLPTFRYALAHHKPESVTAFPPETTNETVIRVWRVCAVNMKLQPETTVVIFG